MQRTHGIAGPREGKKLLVEIYKNRSVGFDSSFSYPADPFHLGGGGRGLREGLGQMAGE